jgi:hypothetical protein
MQNLILRILITPIIPILYAYFELGGNWFAYRMFQGGANWWSVSGTIFFSVVYSLVSAFVAYKLKMDLGLLMVSYGFGFSIISILIKLEWGKIPEFSLDLLKAHPTLWAIAGIALIGFIASSYLVVVTKVD